MTVKHITKAETHGISVDVTFTFVETDDPFVVVMDVLTPDGGVVTWEFDKSLLFDAFEKGRSGGCDITVVYGVDTVEFHLRSPYGEAVMAFEAESLETFVTLVKASSDSEQETEAVERELALFLNDVFKGETK